MYIYGIKTLKNAKLGLVVEEAFHPFPFNFCFYDHAIKCIVSFDSKKFCKSCRYIDIESNISMLEEGNGYSVFVSVEPVLLSERGCGECYCSKG